MNLLIPNYIPTPFAMLGQLVELVVVFHVSEAAVMGIVAKSIVRLGIFLQVLE